MKNKKYDKAAIEKYIIDARATGASFTQIANALNEDGYRNKRGGTFNSGNVSPYIGRVGTTKAATASQWTKETPFQPKEIVPVRSDSPSDFDMLISQIGLSQNLSSTKKTALLRVLVQE